MTHTELADEQRFVDRAYAALEQMKAFAEKRRLKALDAKAQGLDRNVTRAGDPTSYARFQRDAFLNAALVRKGELEIGAQALVFGRLDTTDDEICYIGRLGVLDDEHRVLVSDWRTPAAEPFYRATPRDPLGLRRRRHLICQGQTVLDLDDEHLTGAEADGPAGLATGALLRELEKERTGSMRDIVATIQAEQDEIIRHPIDDTLVVQGPPGTGKTVVALHRAAYLLYTHREYMERRGLLVVGPSQVFLRYIQGVLPALGESGVALTTIGGLWPRLVVTGTDTPEQAHLKGDPRMATVLKRALKDRQRGLRRDLEFTLGEFTVSLRKGRTWRIARSIGRRRGTHNAKRKLFIKEILAAVHAKGLTREDLLKLPQIRDELEWMWPRLSPQEFLHTLFGSRPLLDDAAGGLSPADRDLLFRPWSEREADIAWTHGDLALLDEAAALLGPVDGSDDVVGYGHIVVDEAQKLTPMELRMLRRRSRGTFTLVGDLAQSTGAWSYPDWDAITGHLAAEATVRPLTVNYRGPTEIDAVANTVRERLAEHAGAARAVRSTGRKPVVITTPDPAAAAASEAERLLADRPNGTIAIISARPVDLSGVPHTEPGEPIAPGINLVSLDDVSGLEFDAAVVVEPSQMAPPFSKDLHALYVVITRPTQDLVIVHREPLPQALSAAADQGLLTARR